MKHSLGIDILPVESEEEATELLVHHLALAAAYFEAADAHAAVKIVHKKLWDHSKDAAVRFIETLLSSYNDET